MKLRCLSTFKRSIISTYEQDNIIIILTIIVILVCVVIALPTAVWMRQRFKCMQKHCNTIGNLSSTNHTPSCMCLLINPELHNSFCCILILLRIWLLLLRIFNWNRSEGSCSILSLATDLLDIYILQTIRTRIYIIIDNDN